MISFYDVVTEKYVPIDQPKKVGRYKLGSIIGKGKSCVVRAGVADGGNKTFAVKVMNKLAGHRGTLIQLQFQQEVDALRRITHDHVIILHEYFQTHRRFYIVLDLIPGELLSTYVRSRAGLPEVEVKRLSSQLTSALSCLHIAHVTHRDLKPANIMIDTKTMKVTLIDFGLSGCGAGLMTRPCGTPAYMAPEVTSSMGYGCVVDMWSLGASIVEMLTGSPPNLNTISKKGNYAKLVQRSELFASLPSLSKDCLSFLDQLLQIYPDRRMTSTEALHHTWIREAQDISNQTVTSVTSI